MDTQNDGLEKVSPFKHGNFLVSMLDFWGVPILMTEAQKLTPKYINRISHIITWNPKQALFNGSLGETTIFQVQVLNHLEIRGFLPGTRHYSRHTTNIQF